MHISTFHTHNAVRFGALPTSEFHGLAAVDNAGFSAEQKFCRKTLVCFGQQLRRDIRIGVPMNADDAGKRRGVGVVKNLKSRNSLKATIASVRRLAAHRLYALLQLFTCIVVYDNRYVARCLVCAKRRAKMTRDKIAARNAIFLCAR